MRSVLACVLCLAASASALLAAPRVPLQQQQLAARTVVPQMQQNAVTRVEIEIEQGEPCAPGHAPSPPEAPTARHARRRRPPRSFSACRSPPSALRAPSQD